VPIGKQLADRLANRDFGIEADSLRFDKPLLVAVVDHQVTGMDVRNRYSSGPALFLTELTDQCLLLAGPPLSRCSDVCKVVAGILRFELGNYPRSDLLPLDRARASSDPPIRSEDVLEPNAMAIDRSELLEV
jgi:hypothetical protein